MKTGLIRHDLEKENADKIFDTSPDTPIRKALCNVERKDNVLFNKFAY